MKVSEFVINNNLEVINISDGNREIKTGYAGDLLSVVMSNAPTDSVWFTVMNNVNIIAVASLADISLIVVSLADIPENVVNKAKENNINIVKSNLDVFNTIQMIGKI